MWSDKFNVMILRDKSLPARRILKLKIVLISFTVEKIKSSGCFNSILKAYKLSVKRSYNKGAG